MASKLWGKLGESVSTDLEAEFPGLDLDLYDTQAGYILSKIVLPKEERGFGIGTQVMQRLVDIADSEGKMIALTPDTAFGGSKGRLEKFYKRFGFVPNKGRNKDFSFRETMIRYPRQTETLEEALSDISKSSQVFVDMDGVLADFFGSWKKLVGKDWREIDSKDIPAALQKIRDTKDFWLNIPPAPNAGKLLGLIKKLKGSYSILSAPLPDDPNSEPHKREWIEKYLKVFPPSRVIITHDKEKYATQSDGTPNILIDDFGQNIAKWEAAGGVGFKHKDHKFERTVKNIKQHMQEPVEETVADGKKFVEPNFNSEWEEAERYPEFQKIGKAAWIKLAKKGKEFTIKSAKDINNTDAADPDSFKSLDPNKQRRALAQLEKGIIEMPIVAVYSDGYKELIGGNTRLTAMMAQDGQATVWAFKVPDEVANLAENFADGKVKGKSRPGRVKRAGASCKGSVADLRAKAKKYSGERGKMYHWCANMKAGKKKIKEIQSMTGFPKGKVRYWNHNDELLKKVGKLGDYNIHKSIESEADGGDHVFVIKKDEAPLGELILTQRDSPFAQAKNQGFWTSSVQFDPEIQGKGLAVPLYAYAVKKGYDIVSDDNQSKGSEILWQKLSKQPGIHVYAWDRENNKFFAYDPENDPRGLVYSDENLRQKIIDEYLEMMRKANSQEERDNLDKELKKELADITPDGYDTRLVAVSKKK